MTINLSISHKNKWNLFAAILVMVLSVAINSHQATAHVLEKSSNIAAILHIDPDDNPIENQQQNLLLYFKDNDVNFLLKNCLCHLTISSDGKVISKLPLYPTSSLTSENDYIFKQAGIYDLKIDGQPLSNGSFTPFVLNYVVKVSTQEQAQIRSQNINFSYTVLFVLVQATIIILAYQFFSKKKIF